MVSRDLKSASSGIGDIFTEFDLKAVATAGAGVGAGLFAGEFVGTGAAKRVGGETAGFVADVGSRIGLGALLAQVEKMGNWPPMVSVLVTMAAFGSASSGILRVMESLAERAANQTLGGGSGSATISSANNSATVKRVSSTTTSKNGSSASASSSGGFNTSSGNAW